MSGSKLLHATLLFLIAAQALALPTLPQPASSTTIASVSDAAPTTLIDSFPISVNETPEEASDHEGQESIIKRVKTCYEWLARPKKPKENKPKPKEDKHERPCVKVNPYCAGYPAPQGGEYSMDGMHWSNGVPEDYRPQYAP